MSKTEPADVDRENAPLTASPEQFVAHLYEGAIRQMEKCRAGLADPATRRSAETGASLYEAYSIMGDLRGTLDHQAGGEIARNLDKIYDFTLGQLHEANVHRRAEPVEHGLRVMRTLKEGWDGVHPG